MRKPFLVAANPAFSAYIEADARIVEMAAGGQVSVERRPYRPGEVGDHRFVVAATGDPAVNQQVYDDGEAAAVGLDPARYSGRSLRRPGRADTADLTPPRWR